MLAALLNVPETDSDWERWSYNNYDANNQIRQAIVAQKKIILPEYQLQPIDWDNISFWLEANQQAHISFTNALGQASNDLASVDFDKPDEVRSWIWLNYMEISDACKTLGIGP